MMSRISELNQIGIALSAEKDTRSLLEKILSGAKKLTSADGGTLYSVTDDQQLKFEIVTTDSLKLSLGVKDGQAVKFPPLQLYINQKPNNSMVVTRAVIEDKTINIADVYDVEGYDFSGTKDFDKSTGYRTKSILTVPMKNHEGQIIGVLQLINALDENGDVREFAKEDQQLAESLASQAAVTITQKKLLDQQRQLFESFIELIATSIDEKSPYTGGHCKRVPDLTMMIAEACDRRKNGVLKDFSMDEKDRYELKIAGWLHDCGKITTPEYVVDKATKLETIFDRIEQVQVKAELLKRDAKIDCLEKKIELLESSGADVEKRKINHLEKKYRQATDKIDDDMQFIRQCNKGGEYLDEEHKKRLQKIANQQWVNQDGETVNYLTENELYNLSIERGTLTYEERQVINYHIVMTIKMLESLPFPDYLRNVPEYAGGHHERMDGKGYPNGLTRDEMSVQARIMAVADIFEALTASDRPYKEGKTLSECLFILGKMKEDNHIDPDIFDVFVREKIYMQYAQEFLSPLQIDEVDHSKIPGYVE